MDGLWSGCAAFRPGPIIKPNPLILGQPCSPPRQGLWAHQGRQGRNPGMEGGGGRSRGVASIRETSTEDSLKPRHPGLVALHPRGT